MWGALLVLLSLCWERGCSGCECRYYDVGDAACLLVFRATQGRVLVSSTGNFRVPGPLQANADCCFEIGHNTCSQSSP